MDVAREAIVQVLQADPRSVYRKESCVGQIYPFFVDALDVRVQFVDQDCQVRVWVHVWSYSD